MSKLFRTFIGIDQTGAVRKGGLEARALPCALLTELDFEDGKSVWRLDCVDRSGKPLRLPSFNHFEITNLISTHTSTKNSHESFLNDTALIVDCVMGLAETAWPSCQNGSPVLWNLFERAARCEKFGLEPAAQFFDAILRDAQLAVIPVRRCEILAKANSVFSTRPYQKNIQCGTYRIWRDIGLEMRARGAHQRWLRFWNFDPLLAESSNDEAWFFEGYPSLVWREILGAATRDISDLKVRIKTLLKEVYPNEKIQISNQSWALIESDADHADAAVLALGAWHLQMQNRLFMKLPREKWLKREGWIMGLNFSGRP